MAKQFIDDDHDPFSHIFLFVSINSGFDSCIVRDIAFFKSKKGGR